MCGELGVQLLFIPEEYGGMGGGAFDVYRVCELMGRIDLGIATSVLATFLGSDPILFGGTEEQKARRMGRIAEEGILMAYGAKMWISNGGYADLYSVLAKAPGGPTWFVLEKTRRASPTASPRRRLGAVSQLHPGQGPKRRPSGAHRPRSASA